MDSGVGRDRLIQGDRRVKIFEYIRDEFMSNMLIVNLVR